MKSKFLFDLAVGVVDDGKEHVEQDKEHDEDVTKQKDDNHLLRE